MRDDSEQSEQEREMNRRIMRPSDKAKADEKASSKRAFGKKVKDVDDVVEEDAESVPDDPYDHGIDLSQGPLRGKELFNTKKVRSELKQQLRAAGIRDVSTRKEVTDMILGKRTHGLNKEELRSGFKALKAKGKITKIQERNIRRELGIKRKSGMF